jgi:hypothetical protein
MFSFSSRIANRRPESSDAIRSSSVSSNETLVGEMVYERQSELVGEHKV